MFTSVQILSRATVFPRYRKSTIKISENNRFSILFTPLPTPSLSSVDELYLFAWQFSRNLDDVGREWTSLHDAVAAHVTP